MNFLEAYKRLDELCKQIFSAEIGVSRYLEEMEKEINGSFYVRNWEKDYNRLKHMRWVRNQLAHDADSFKKNLVNSKDIEWITQFQSRIINCTDPFSLLNQTRTQTNSSKTKVNVKEQYTNNSGTSENKKNKAPLLVVILLTILFFLFVFSIPTIVTVSNNIIKLFFNMEQKDNLQKDVEFETLVFSGEGSKTIQNINVPNGNYYVIGKYYGDGNFIAELHKSVKDNFGQLIANKIGKCESIFGLQGPIENGYINVESASGKWEFKIVACENISKNNLVSEYVYNGSGAKVIPNINLPEGEYYITCAYSGNGNFAVTFYNNISNSFGDLIANEIGKSETTYGIKGPIRQGYIDVNMADGDWTITIEPCQ